MKKLLFTFAVLCLVASAGYCQAEIEGTPFSKIEKKGDLIRLQFPGQGIRWRMSLNGSPRDPSNYGEVIELRIGDKLELMERHGQMIVEPQMKDGSCFLMIDQTFDARSFGGEVKHNKYSVPVEDAPGGVAPSKTAQQANRPDPLMLTIKSDKQVYEVGEEIKIEARFTNTGDSIARILLCDREYKDSLAYNYLTAVIEPFVVRDIWTGTQFGLAEYPSQTELPWVGEYLEPKKSVSFTIPLTQKLKKLYPHFEIRPNIYGIHFVYKPDKNASHVGYWIGTLTSNTITIEVAGKGAASANVSPKEKGVDRATPSIKDDILSVSSGDGEGLSPEKELEMLKSKIAILEEQCTPKKGTPKEEVERIFGKSGGRTGDFSGDFKFLNVRYDDSDKVISATYYESYARQMPTGDESASDLLVFARLRLEQMENTRAAYLNRLNEISQHLQLTIKSDKQVYEVGEKGKYISEAKAIGIARKAYGSLRVPQDAPIDVVLQNGSYIVTFKLREKDKVAPPGYRYRGPDYFAKITLDAKSGEVLKTMSGGD